MSIQDDLAFLYFFVALYANHTPATLAIALIHAGIRARISVRDIFSLTLFSYRLTLGKSAGLSHPHI